MKTRIFAIITALILTLSMVSCSTASNDMVKTEDYYYSPVDTDSYYDMDNSGMGYETAPSETDYGYSKSETPSVEENDLSNRKIIKNAVVNFQTKEFDAFLTGIKSLVNSHAGYISLSDTRGGGAYDSNYSRTASMTIRIPAENYNSFMEALPNLGSITYQSESMDDVTMQYVDIESRIKALETEYDALMKILEKADYLSDVIQLQSRISEVNYQLDSYKSQLLKYDNLISYCTINITVTEVAKERTNVEKMSFGQRISEGLSDTFEELGEGFENFAVWFVVELPNIVVTVAILAIAFLIIRLIVKSSKRRKEYKTVERLIKQNEEKKDSTENS